MQEKTSQISGGRAAELVWLDVDLCYKWLDVDLQKTATEGQNSKDMLEGLSEKAKQRFIEFRKKDLTVCPKESPSKWPTNMLAANCMYGMYGICQTLLVSSDIIEFENSKIMFDKLSIMITDHGHNRRLSYKPTKSYAMPPWHH